MSKSPIFNLVSIKIEPNYGGYEDDVIQILNVLNENVITIGKLLIYVNDGVKTSSTIVHDEKGEAK